MDSPAVILPIDRFPTELLLLTLHHLGQLSPLTLLISQRVCHVWHTLITESPILQRDLYFRPPAVPPTRTPATNLATDFSREEEKDKEVASNSDANTDTDIDLDTNSLATLFNPLLLPTFGPLFFRTENAKPPGYVRKTGSGRGWRKSNEYAAFTLLPWAHTDEKKEKVLRKEASWRRMMVCKRKIRRLACCNRHNGQLGYSTQTRVVEFEEREREDEAESCEKEEEEGSRKIDEEDVGMTMQDFYELLLSGDVLPRPDEFASWTLFPGKTLSRSSHSEAGRMGAGTEPRSLFYREYGDMYYCLKDAPVEGGGEDGTSEAVLLSRSIAQCSVGRHREREHAAFRIPGETVVKRYFIKYGRTYLR